MTVHIARKAGRAHIHEEQRLRAIPPTAPHRIWINTINLFVLLAPLRPTRPGLPAWDTFLDAKSRDPHDNMKPHFTPSNISDGGRRWNWKLFRANWIFKLRLMVIFGSGRSKASAGPGARRTVIISTPSHSYLIIPFLPDASVFFPRSRQERDPGPGRSY